MKVFVWQRIKHATDSYHEEGGVVVFAESEEAARELALAKGATIAPDEAPDDVRDVFSGGIAAIYIMPDAGCC